MMYVFWLQTRSPRNANREVATVQTHTYCTTQVDKNVQNRTSCNGIEGWITGTHTRPLQNISQRRWRQNHRITDTFLYSSKSHGLCKCWRDKRYCWRLLIDAVSCVQYTTNGMCAKSSTKVYAVRKAIEWSRRVISLAITITRSLRSSWECVSQWWKNLFQCEEHKCTSKNCE